MSQHSTLNCSNDLPADGFSLVGPAGPDGLGLPVLLKNFLLTFIELNFLAAGAVEVAVRGGVDVRDAGDRGRKAVNETAGEGSADILLATGSLLVDACTVSARASFSAMLSVSA